MFGLGKSKGENSLEKNEEFLRISRNGWDTSVTLPEYEVSSSHGMLTKGVATAALGIVGLAMTMGSSSKNRKIRTTARIANKGIVINNGTVDGSALKIPWNSILNLSKIDPMGGTLLKLTDGSQIIIHSPPFRLKMPMSVLYTEEFVNYVNNKSNGQLEDGW